MKRLTALPTSARRADPDKLRARQQALAAQRKNTTTVYRAHCLAVATQIRRENQIMTDQDRIKLLREKANRHDQISRELHAAADQLEERHATDAMRELRQRSHGNPQTELSTMDVRQVSQAGGIKPGCSYAMDGNRTIQPMRLD